MKQWYQCEKCKKYYKTDSEALACESRDLAAELAKEEERKKREEKKEELSAMLEEYYKKSAELNTLGREIVKRGGRECLLQFLWM